MILAVDVAYSGNHAVAAGVMFDSWKDAAAQKDFVTRVDGVADYEPGSFYKRELPCILKLLAEHHLEPDCIVVDGYVFLDGVSKPGLGKLLYDSLNREVAVVGVAKKRFKEIDPKFEVHRGSSKRPLYVTAVGMDAEQAKENIRAMHGASRIPTLLKLADQISREIERLQFP